MVVLKSGSKGSAVKQLQQRLNDLGFDAGTPDGDFRGKTELAVKQFQKSRGLKDDGIAGNETLAVLYALKPMKVKAPSGVVFDIVNSFTTDNERLNKFRPGELVGDNEQYYLPRFYIAINSQEDLDKQLTEHFKLKEFISDEEQEKGDVTFPYYMPVANIRLAQALEELRTDFDNQPLKLSSGYRSPFYYQKAPNRASPHRFGTAVDIAAVGDTVLVNLWLRQTP